MAYIPPHKRHSLDKEKPSPRAELLSPHFSRKLNLRPENSKIDWSGKIIYAASAKSSWFPIDLSGNDPFPSHVHLQPISLESIERKSGEKRLILVNSYLPEESRELGEDDSRSPWVAIAEKVKRDVLDSFERLRNEIYQQGSETVKLTLVARVCKILFHGSLSGSLGSVQENKFDESVLASLRRSLYTNVPSSYMENIINEVVPKIGVDFVDEKDIYHVKLSDKTMPESTISCKCSVKADKKLHFYKVELNQVRQMVTDISCLDKNLDLRLMLCTKRILTALSDDEMNSIRDLISSAVLDSDMKGGLRWPLGKASSGGRYSVVGVWHTISKSYKSSSLRLKARHADRFDFRSGTGEATREVYLKLKGLVSELQEHGAESDAATTMLKDNLRLIWNNFLQCEPFLT